MGVKSGSMGSCWFRDRAWPGAPCPPSTACSRHRSSSVPAPPRSSPGGACWRCRRSRLRYDRIEDKEKKLGRKQERDQKMVLNFLRGERQSKRRLKKDRER